MGEVCVCVCMCVEGGGGRGDGGWLLINKRVKSISKHNKN